LKYFKALLLSSGVYVAALLLSSGVYELLRIIFIQVLLSSEKTKIFCIGYTKVVTLHCSGAGQKNNVYARYYIYIILTCSFSVHIYARLERFVVEVLDGFKVGD
jgi:hypothetical protein